MFYKHHSSSKMFSVSFDKIRHELSEIRGTEISFIDMFCHTFQRPSP